MAETTQSARARPLRWVLESPGRLPLALLRIWVGAWALRFAYGLDPRAKAAARSLLDADWVARDLPALGVTVFRLPGVATHPEGARAVALAAATGLVLGLLAKPCAFVLWLLVVSATRIAYPMASPLDEALAIALLGVLVVPASSKLALARSVPAGTRAAVAGFVLFAAAKTLLDPGGMLADPAAATLVGGTLALGLGALATKDSLSPSNAALELSAVACLVLLLVQPGQSIAAGLGMRAQAEALAELGFDLGLRSTTRPAGQSKPRVAFRQPSGHASSATALWSDSARVEAALAYLRDPRGALGEPPELAQRIATALRQELADRACAVPHAGTIDVGRGSEPFVLSFRCDGKRGRLVPRAITPDIPYGVVTGMVPSEPAALPLGFAASAYAGSDSCGPCHATAPHAPSLAIERHARTLATDPTTFATVFPNETLLVGTTRVEFSAREAAPRVAVRSDALRMDGPIALALGSADALQAYAARDAEDRLRLLPVGWSRGQAALVPARALGEAIGPEHVRFVRSAFASADDCLDCHATGAFLALRPNGYRKTWVEAGVGCESCHGASADHVRQARAGSVQLPPSGLPPQASCVRCHGDAGDADPSASASAAERAARARKAEFERAPNMAYDEQSLRQYLHDVYAVARRPPIREWLRLAQLRTTAREYDEAVRLVELALLNATARERGENAELERLLREVRRVAGVDTTPR